MAILRVRAGQVGFHGQPDRVPFEGFAIGPAGFRGWDDGPPMSRSVVSRVQAAGAFDVPALPGPRTILIAGTAIAPSPERLNWFRDLFTGLGALGNSLPIVVEHMGKAQTARGRLDDRSTFEVVRGLDHAKFQAQFWCADPRKFGEAHLFGPATSVTVFHHGNFGAAPVFTVDGTMASGYRIDGPSGKQFIVTAAVTAGHPHTIDMRTGLLRVDGAIVYGAISKGDTWAVPPGVPVSQTLVPVAGSGTLSAKVIDESV